MRKITLLLILLLFQIHLFSQDLIRISIDEYEVFAESARGQEFKYLHFDNAVNKHGYGALPLYKLNYELPDELFEISIEIIPESVELLSDNQSQEVLDIDLLSDDFQVFTEYEGNIARVYVLPLRYTNDGIESLFEFTVSLTLLPTEDRSLSRSSNVSYAEESVLATGTWIKMGITETGIYRLDYEELVAMGVSPDEISVNNAGVFGTYSGVLPESNAVSRYDDLKENSILPVGLDDNSFDQQDYILFYAQGPTTWKYNPFTGRFLHNINYYSDTSYYFFTPDRGSLKTIEDLDGNTLSPTDQVTSFLDYQAHELNLENMMSTGRQWFGEDFTNTSGSKEFGFNFPNILTDEPVYLGVQFMARAFDHSYYDVYANQQHVVDSVRIRYISSSLGIYGRISSSNVTFLPDSDDLNIKIDFESRDINGTGWLDYIVLNAYRQLSFVGDQMKFCNPHVSSTGKITRFIVDNTSSGDQIWDITDIHNPKKVLTDFNGGSTQFTVPTDSLKIFTIYNGNSYHVPVSYEIIANQNLHSISNVNYIIIRPDIFADEAERLAQLHREFSGLKVVTVDLDEVYNEFSSGSQDVSAIRDFMRMLYKRNAFNSERAYLMLFGDASFDYKDRVHNNTNLVPTYEALESLRETGSFVTDDYFGLLDDEDGLNAIGNVDIGIGRFPVDTKEEATIAVDKVEHYIKNSSNVMRDWRSVICFIADDMDNNTHLKQAEGLADIADTLDNGLRINKIYLDSYKKVTVPGGFRYPDVNQKINEQIEDGALIVNYTGHGGLIGWSDEMVLDVPMINAFNNIDNLPLIITATCEFSRFDNPEFVSAGEYTFLNRNGGGIALLTTTRLAYSHANFIVNRRIYNNLLKSTDDGTVPRLGDLVRLSKIPYDDNFLNFALLGDPALMLAYPDLKVVTTLDNEFELTVNDTVHALSVVGVSGEIRDQIGNVKEDFNGYVYPKVYDKVTDYWTLGNDGNSYPQQFDLYDKILFDGVVRVENGVFNFEFRIPKDISYKYGFGKIVYYAVDTLNYIDAWGGYEELMVGGIDENAIDDNEGPDIGIYLNNSGFSSGDVVTSNPVLYSRLFDESGINYTGVGLGRDIILTLDGNHSEPIIVNEYFEPDINSYSGGTIVYPFSNLEEGFHTLSLKAWDLNNNSSETAIEFYVNDNMAITLYNVITKPNPFYDQTEFVFNHNKYGSDVNVVIRIYDINGEFVAELDSEMISVNRIIWDGRNFNNSTVSDGVYTYVIQVTDNYGNITLQQQKLIKLSR